jgi:hypothetical protein
MAGAGRLGALPPNTSLELTPTVAPKNRVVRGVGIDRIIESSWERSSARSR